jgi:allantoin racemase
MKIMHLSKLPRKTAIIDVATMQKQIAPFLSPGTEVVFDFPDDYDGSRAEDVLGKQNMLNGVDHAMVTAPLIRKIVWAAENGFDAVVQSNTFDPGVEAGRLTVSIPVIGLLRTSLHMATILADRIGILVPLESHVPYTWRILRGYDMDHLVTNVLPLGLYGRDLARRVPEIKESAVGLINKLKDGGAHFILPLGGVIIPYLVDPVILQMETGVPVMNTKLIALRFAETCVTLGLTHSPLSYPRGKLTYSDLVERL